MAHNITETDKFGFVGDRKGIWHGLGTQIEEGQSARDVAKQLGLDWGTELLPVFAESELCGRMELPDNRLHVRVNQDGTRAPLGMVSKNYRSFDNLDLADYGDSLLGADKAMSVSTASSLLGGKRVFFLFKMPGSFEVASGDQVDTYFLLSNGHGGFASLQGYPTGVRVVCNNTLTLSERDLSRGFRFSHAGDFEGKLEQARLILGYAQEEMTKFEQQARALAATDLSTGQIKDFMESAFTATFGKAPDADADAEMFQKFLDRKTAVLEDWMERLENERQTIPGIQGTAWAALNAYTEWSDHARGGKWMENRGSDHRVHSNLFGIAAATKKKVLRQALTLA